MRSEPAGSNADTAKSVPLCKSSLPEGIQIKGELKR